MTPTTYRVLHPETYGLLGFVSLNDGPRKDVNGWWFISHVASHGNGRKAWPTASQAIPKWARRAKLVTA